MSKFKDRAKTLNLQIRSSSSRRCKKNMCIEISRYLKHVKYCMVMKMKRQNTLRYKRSLKKVKMMFTKQGIATPGRAFNYVN